MRSVNTVFTYWSGCRRFFCPRQPCHRDAFHTRNERWQGGHRGRGRGAQTPSGGGDEEHVAPPVIGHRGERGVCDSPWRRSSHRRCVRPQPAVGVARRRGSPWRSRAGGAALEVAHRGGPPSRWSVGGGHRHRCPAPPPGRRGGA
jgi:hypothetical protein